jgi:hypothetical protein
VVLIKVPVLEGKLEDLTVDVPKLLSTFSDSECLLNVSYYYCHCHIKGDI